MYEVQEALAHTLGGVMVVDLGGKDAWPDHLAAFAVCVYLCLVVRDDRARVSTAAGGASARI